MSIRFSHPHLRIRDIEESLDFYCGKLGLVETSRKVADDYTLLYLSAPSDIANARDVPPPVLELAHVGGDAPITDGTRFAHIAFYVDDLDATCARLAEQNVTISVPPHPLGFAYILTPDGMTIELLRRPD